MKTRLFAITGTILLIGMFGSVLSNFQHVDALCVRNQDWPGAPCYGCPGCTPSLEQQKDDWAPYFSYKGEKFMEKKKQEMLDAIQNNQLDGWLGSGARHQNSNVYHYYQLHGITNEMMFYGLSQDLGLILTAIAITFLIGIVILKRK